MLIAAFAPTVSRALASRGAALLAGDICFAPGSRAAKPPNSGVSDAVNDDGRSLPRLIGDCPYCTLHASDQAPPPAASVFRFTLAAGRPLPISFQAVPRPPSAWPSSHPRAPPEYA